jgi:hypothetical protein
MGDGLIAEGKYRGRASDWMLGKAGTGTEQIGVLFDFLDVTEDDGKPFSMSWYGAFTDKALPHTVKGLRACGWEGSDPSELDERKGGLDANEVQLVVEHEEYEGEMRAKIRWVNKLGGLGMNTPLEGGDLKSFGARMKAKILALDPSNAAKHAKGNGKSPAAKPAPKAPPRDDAPPPGDDDIPF